jgi:hypothetical protein
MGFVSNGGSDRRYILGRGMGGPVFNALYLTIDTISMPHPQEQGEPQRASNLPHIFVFRPSTHLNLALYYD